MGKRVIVIVGVMFLVTACGRPASKVEKLAQLDVTENEERANLFRAKAECQAQYIEFNDAQMYRDCMDGVRTLAEISQSIFDALAKRRAEINAEP
jgi:hypothetical protein